MDNQKWLETILQKQINHEPGFARRALLERAQDFVREQGKRITQAQGELDGRVWNHQKW